MMAVDYLDPLELCPKDRAEGEKVKVAVHALMLNPNYFSARLVLMMYVFGNNALYFIGKSPVFVELRDRNRELFELANQVAMAFCSYKLAQCIYKYDRRSYSLKSFIWHIYRYAKETVKGYVKKVSGVFVASDPRNKQLADEFGAYLRSDTWDELPYHIDTYWAEAVSSALSKHAKDFGLHVSLVKTIQVGGETETVTAADGSKHFVKKGHHEEQLKYIALDMSHAECERALAELEAHGAPLYRDTETNQCPTMTEAEFERFRDYYLKNSTNNTVNQRVNREVNLAIGRLYLCEKASPTEIVDALGPEYPRQVAAKLDGFSAENMPGPLTVIKVRGRIYQNIVPMRTEFMKVCESCISGDEQSSPSMAKEGSSACST
jgi:hypothetical protein